VRCNRAASSKSDVSGGVIRGFSRAEYDIAHARKAVGMLGCLEGQPGCIGGPETTGRDEETLGHFCEAIVGGRLDVGMSGCFPNFTGMSGCIRLGFWVVQAVAFIGFLVHTC
jgi:hypothetical protein